MENKILKFALTLTLVAIIIYAFTAHSCSYDNCTHKGEVVFHSDYEEWSDGWCMDRAHFDNPALTPEKLETYIFSNVEN